MPRRARPRLERAIRTEEGAASDALSQLNEALPKLMTEWIKQAGSNPQLASSLLRLIEDDLLRAKRGSADELLIRIIEVRNAGSEILMGIWNQAAKRAYTSNIAEVPESYPRPSAFPKPRPQLAPSGN